MRRWKMWILAIMLAVGLCAGQVYAEEIVPETETVQETGEELEAAAVVAGSSTITEAAKVLKAAMVKRQSSVDVPLAVGASIGPEDAEKILNKAYAHTSKGEEGDYLKRQVVYTQITFDTSSGQTVLHYSFCYMTTATQEQKLVDFIKDFEAKYKISSRSTNYEKILSIYEFVCDSVAYDDARKDNAKVITSKADFVRSNYVQQTAYAAAINQTAVCEGYASLFYRLAMYYGIDARIVTGSSYGENHGWNLVKYDGKYYHLDATWDSGSGRRNLRYFLKSTDEMNGDHWLDKESRAVVDSLPMAESSYPMKEPKVVTSGKYKYMRSYGAVIVGISNEAGGSLSIPGTLGGYPVVAMDASVSSDRTTDYETTTLTLPEGMYRVKGYTWMFHSAKTVTFPSTMVMNSESMNALNLFSLATVKLNSGSKTLKVVDNVLFTKDGRNLVKYPGASTRTSYTVPAGTVQINTAAFDAAANLKKVVLPDQLEVIEDFAFDRCSELTTVNFPGSLKYIGQWAFGSSKVAGTVTLPTGLDWYGGAVFAGASVTGFKIGSGNAFGYFTRNGVLCLDYNREGVKQVVEAPRYMSDPRFSVPNDFLYVTGNSFRLSNIREISLNDELVEIGNCALEECHQLTKVIVPPSVRSLDDRAFGFNENHLKSVYVLSKDLEIWGDPFAGTATTVYGYKGSTIEAYCKGQPDLTFKEITGPVYNWGVKGERCSVTILNSKGKPVAHPCTVTSKKQVENGIETGVVIYTATYKTSTKTYTNTKTIKMDYKPTIRAGLTTFSKSTTVTVGNVKESAAVTYKSSNPGVATVSSTGKVTAVSVGKVTITATLASTTHYNSEQVSIELKVVPWKTSFTSLTNTSTGVSMKWEANGSAGGYKIYRDGKLIKTVTDAMTTSYTNTASLTNGTAYTYKIVAYREGGDGLTYQATAYEKKIVYLARPTLSDVSCSAAGTMKVTWAKKTSVSGYQIQYSTSSTFATNNHTVSVSGSTSVSKSIASLTKGKSYYVRIRTYKTVDGTKYYSAYTAKKSVTITK